MEVHHDNVGLSTAEMSFLWRNYIGDTMLVCIFEHFLRNIDDKDIENIVSSAKDLANKHIQQAKDLFIKEDFPIPHGFGEQDVNLEAPRLFTDKFYLYYLIQALRGGIANYSLAFSSSHREDIRMYFMHCIHEDTELFNQTMKLMLEKGLTARPPEIPTPKQVDFVENKDFLGEWFGENRPLTSIEITKVFMNIENNLLGTSLMTAFSQTAKEPKLREYFQDGHKVAIEQVEKFSQLLAEDSLSYQPSWVQEVTDSKEPAFSDYLMLYHVGVATATGIGNYGISIATSQRRDLAAMYTKLGAQIGKYAEKGARLTIEYGWLEQPPMAIDRNELQNK
ncbi:DUF3231 family protein [Cytobacillus sp. S13-E01]|uniref:DUF3231 family protein n=1 Tax=Cytobacillus sp. S13-E01 TaxID=3031326 RepID=UPI0023D811E0|nr:DUF3231 family protein [Cytobacillus sp. S13-E01]MDF0726413.1 DUF3231 family protein [Cytobacillus sp. S13-E01]